jgi:hypothetical protein
MTDRTRGIALPLAVFALVIIGALVSGAFFVGRQEQAVGRNSVKVQQAFAAAEAGAQRTVAAWVAERYNRLPPGGSAPIGGNVGSAGWYRGEIRRLNPQLFLVRSEGFSPDSTARQHVGLLVRLESLPLDLTAALSSATPPGHRASWTLDGMDRPPQDWDCPPAGPGVPGISVGGAFPDLAPLADAATLRVGGQLMVEPAVSAGVCDLSDMANWGSPSDPGGPCGGHFPVIWSESSLQVTGGEGQGILVVNGDLEAGGGFRFAGPVIVRGNLLVGGAGAEFEGGVITGEGADAVSPSGPAAIRYSRCALDRALEGSARAVLLRERSWVNLY